MSSPSNWPTLGTPVRSSADPPSSSQARPSSGPSNWSQPGSFYLSGSSAPTLVHQYRSSRHPPAPPHPHPRSDQSQYPSPSSSRAGSGSLTGRDKDGGAVLMTEAVCCCCGSGLRYPRDSYSYRCGVCLVVGEGRERRRGTEGQFRVAQSTVAGPSPSGPW